MCNLSKLTSCCQSLGGAGENAAIFGITSKKAGFYVLCRKSDNVIVSQCLAWRSAASNIVLDSIETQQHFYAKYEKMTCDFYNKLASTLTIKYGVGRVSVGTGGQTPDNLGSAKTLKPDVVSILDQENFIYDAFVQRIMSDQKFPIMEMHELLDNRADLQLPIDLSNINKDTMDEWVNIFIMDNKINYLNYLFKHCDLEKMGISKVNIDNQLAWLDFLDNYDTFDGNRFAYLEKAINSNVNINLSRNDTNHILVVAANNGELDVIKRIFPGIVMNGDNVVNALLSAAKSGHSQLVLYFLDNGIDVNSSNAAGNTVLFEILSSDNLQKDEKIELIKLCIERGADLNKIYNNNTVLRECITNNMPIELLDYLTQHGADLNILPASRYICSAARLRNTNILEWLVKKGVDISSKDNNGRTALHYAAMDCSLANIKWLIEVKSFNVMERDINSKLPIELISHNSMPHNMNEVIQYLKTAMEKYIDLEFSPKGQGTSF